MNDAELDRLWNFGDPAASERAFRAALAAAGDSTEFRARILSQVARSLGLQQKFDDALEVLQEAEEILRGAPDGTAARARILLEHGRVLNSAGRDDRGRAAFLGALDLAAPAGLEYLAVDAAHMLGIVEPPAIALDWNRRAIRMAEEAKDPRARNWLGPLYNNTAWTLHDGGDPAAALELFEKALAWRREKQDPPGIRIADWCVARALRTLRRPEEALRRQQALLEAHAAAGTRDGHVFEELGECLLALDRGDEAAGWFAKAWEELSRDPWLKSREGPRLERLRTLGRIPPG